MQQDDGTVVTLPESLAPAPDPVTPPVDDPGQALPVDATPIDAGLGMPTPNESPVPSSVSPDLMGLPPPPELAPVAPVSLLPVATDQMPPAAPVTTAPISDATSGTPPIDPLVANMAPAPDSMPPYTAEDQAIDAVRTQSAAAANAANEQAEILRRQQADLDDMEADRAEADRRTADHRAGLVAAAEKAADDFASYDVTPEEKTSVGAAIAMIFGGIGNILLGNYAGANPVIAILERKADAAARSRQAQQSKLGQLANMRAAAVDNATSWAKDEQAQFSSTKAGLLESYAREIESRAASFAAPAEIAKGEQAAAKIREAAAAARAEAADAEHKRQIEEAKLSLDQVKTETDRYQAQTARKAIGVQYARIGEDRRQFNLGRGDSLNEKDRQYQLELAKLDLEIEKAAKSGDAQSVAVKREQREAMENDRGRSIGVVPVATRDASGNITGIAYAEPLQAKTPKIGADGKPVLDTDGKPVMEQAPFRAPTPKRAEELADKGAAVEKSVVLIDRLIRARDKHGWSSDLFKSDEWREMAADYGQLILVAKDAAGLGALAGPDVEILNKAFGTKDPTELRDPGAGLTAARRNMISGYNSDLRSNGYTGDAFDIPDVSSNAGLKKAASTSPEAAIVDEMISASRKGRGADLTGRISNDGVVANPHAEFVVEKITPLATLANNGDAGARAAIVRLSRDKVLGKDVKLYVVANNIDLGTYASPDDLADFRKTYEKAPRGILGNVIGHETGDKFSGIKPARPPKTVSDWIPGGTR